MLNLLPLVEIVSLKRDTHPGCLIETKQYLQHFFHGADQVEICEAQLLEALLDENADRIPGFTRNTFFLDVIVDIILDEDNELTLVVETNSIQDRETNLGQRAHAERFSGDGEEDDGIIGEMFCFDGSVFCLPIINLGIS